MSTRLRREASLGAAVVVVLAIAVPIAFTRTGGHAASTTAPVAPLSAVDRRVLVADRALIDSLPVALSEVPRAAADRVPGLSSRRAAAQLASITALGPLSDAVQDPAAVTARLLAAYRDVVSGQPPQLSGGALAEQLEELQSVEGDIVPAIRVLALRSGRHWDATAAITGLASDRRTSALARLLAAWQQVYGDFVLVGQAIAS